MSLIPQMMDTLRDLEDDRSKTQLATIIRRQIEREMVEAGLGTRRFDVTPRELETAKDGKKLDAVKLYKDRTGKGLMDSKRAIEAAMDDVPYYSPPPAEPRGPFRDF